MNPRGVLQLLGRELLLLALVLLPPAVVAWVVDGGGTGAFLWPAIGAAIVGGAVVSRVVPEPEARLGRVDTFVLVTLGWLLAALVGAIPYIALRGTDQALGGLFESLSGFTTTGASVLDGIDRESQALLLWRSMTQWVGGMGVILLGIAVLPRLGIGGMDQLGPEAPGPIRERLAPRLVQAGRRLGAIYVLLTAVLAVLLMLLGAGGLDAINHAFTTLSTGGFSTFDENVAGFANPAIELVLVVFMLIAGASFVLHYHLLLGRPRAMLSDPELRTYVTLWACTSILLTAALVLDHRTESIFELLRQGAFQAAAVLSTTGFHSTDFDNWPDFSRALLFLLMFVGASTASTGGSIKVVRVLIVAKKLIVDLKRLPRPRAVFPVRIGRRGIRDEVVTSVVTYFILTVLVFAAGGLLLAVMGLDSVTAFGASATCLANVGPGFGNTGPTAGYAELPVRAKLVLMVLMLLGRLELVPIMGLLAVWRR